MHRANFKTLPLLRATMLSLLAPVLALAGTGEPVPVPAEDVPAYSGNGTIYRIELHRGIDPASTEFLLEGLKTAQEKKAAAFLIEMDTPGGLLESTRQIVQAFLASDIPILVYVAPSGARAGSAGVFITMAAHVAAMAPGTNIGAAHPVGLGGKDIEGEMKKKIENDAAASVKSIADQRGRNAEWAEKAVRDSDSVTAEKALELNAIDLIAKDVRDLLAQADGREVTLGADRKVRLALKDAVIEEIEPNLRQRLLKGLSDPGLVFILMLLGALGVFIEVKNPGLIYPGVFGALCLLLAFGVQTLPVNWVGVILMAASLAFFIAEAYVTSFGLLTVAGLACLFIGGYILFDVPGSMGYQVPMPILVGVSVGFAAVAVGLGVLVARTYMTKSAHGDKALVGETGDIVRPVGPGITGKVFLHGEYWDAESESAIETVGAKVRVVSVEGMKIKVAPV